MKSLRNASGTHDAGPDALNHPPHGCNVEATGGEGLSVRIEGLGPRALHVKGQASMVVCGVPGGGADVDANAGVSVRVSLVDGASGDGGSACAGGGGMGVAGCVESPIQEFVLRRKREPGGACACTNSCKAADARGREAAEGATRALGGGADADEHLSSRDVDSGGSAMPEGMSGSEGVQEASDDEEDAEEGCGRISQRASRAWATLVYHLDYLKGPLWNVFLIECVFYRMWSLCRRRWSTVSTTSKVLYGRHPMP